jgi:hypothetical protein
MANLIYDAALSFGKLSAIANGNFPGILNLGRKEGSRDHYPGKESASAGRLTVDVCLNTPAGGTNMTVAVQGSKDGVTGWADVGTNVFTLAEMQAGPVKTAVSPNEFQYLRVNIAVTGTFTGTAQAFLNTYAGK